MITYIVLKVLAELVLPPASLAVGVVLCLILLLFRLKRLAIASLALALAETLVLSFPPVGDALLLHLENEARQAARATPRCCFDDIVVLGGALLPAVLPERELPLITVGAERLWAAAKLYREGVAPRIVVSGGSYLEQQGHEVPLESAAMRRFLVSLGIPADAIVEEGRSLNTIENMREVHALVGNARVALVTSGYHMPRSLRIAEREGLNVAAFPTDFRVLGEPSPFWEEWLPTADGLGRSLIAVRELIALTFDWRIRAIRR
jgi:uncharacterized SAM-binding protein YcdF (DUF218 family)